MANSGENQHKHNVHKVLAHSYSMYFVLFLVGVTLDLIFKIKIFISSFMAPMGAFLLIFGSILILWAQLTSRNLKKENISKETFCHGPYCFTRTPTNSGLFSLMFGFGIITNSFFVVLSALLSFIIGKFVFLNKEEKILVEKYGTPYLEYKKTVRF
ncbi:TPA: hypothetical protein DEQ22_01795 [Candidatus Nomurabacteria bacterium]|uniref:Steroid 5-alpha reductase C-terminal domain-containing protein n=2 Tax=Candidatus Nomuraibacteriota TaxID=1752729 RepID=A0A1F6YP15_9BACT|nr:MAG: hypothetical protein UV13_C0013G0008 [Parcubacteria group bacterium GW2011_GWC1_42_21]KKS58479.1 MAG: hypothetical protein UV23_C0006G0005 [Candidatus Nomurabacteria bacterium GW2011_GWF1_42_40]KKS99378.1 MAG: hypothetical protein UV77_C0014G0008 [Candidatus Nomurabacteria bacterium GW2011_GWA1_43_17]KKT06575.1 MAG: hypothetical protein UV85_C0017G0008 [Candidatus Nomurabacteria bacterium GW2011_GWB1_43_19]KKT10343.1 MAG: hypothetical protein UV91_C0014G0008 [Candidatus Nomurabacteria b